MEKNKILIGARMEQEIVNIIDKVAKEKKIDRTTAIKFLVSMGWQELQMEKALDHYSKGIISLDKAAEMTNLTVNEMMQIVAAKGIKSEETIEEYKKGLKALIRNDLRKS